MIKKLGGPDLISLIEQEKTLNQNLSVTKKVRADFASIVEARRVGMTWSTIASGLGFSEKLYEVANAFNRINKRGNGKEREAMSERNGVEFQKRGKEVKPERKGENGIRKIQKVESTTQNDGDFFNDPKYRIN